MNLYKIARKDNIKRNEAAGFVIRAETLRRVKELAAKNAGDEGDEVWLGDSTSFEYLAFNVKGSEVVVLKDFNAG